MKCIVDPENWTTDGRTMRPSQGQSLSFDFIGSGWQGLRLREVRENHQAASTPSSEQQVCPSTQPSTHPFILQRARVVDLDSHPSHTGAPTRAGPLPSIRKSINVRFTL